MFGDLRIGVRLGGGFAVVVGLFAVTLLAVGASLSQLTQDVRQINEVTLPYVLVVDEMDVSRSEVQQFLTDVATTYNTDGYKDAEEQANRFLSGVEKFKQKFQRENDADNLKKMEAIEAAFNKFHADGKVMADEYLTWGLDAGNAKMKDFDKVSETLSDDLAKFRAQQVAEANNITASTLSAANSTMTGMIWGSIAAALLAAVFGVWIVRGILRQLGGEPGYAAEVMSRIADGDLTVKVQTQAGDSNSMLYAMKVMSENLANIVSEVRSNTEAITTSSQEIAQGNADLSQRTEEQASSLEETAASMEELTSTVRQNAENARQANQLANSASDIAVKGGKVVGDVVHTMASISDSSKKIVDIISVIDGIAFQTNILALNAAVESARSGEQGRGFAVVAGEVRNLAQRSAAAAKEIKTLIGDSVSKVDAGSRQVEQAGATMSEIVQAVKRVTDIMAEIAAASNEQSAGIEQVNQAITQMDEVTQQNAALVEEAAAAAESMQEQAEVLMHAVSIFKLERGRESAQKAVAKPANRPAIAHHHATTAVARRKERKLVKTPESNDGDWKEF